MFIPAVALTLATLSPASTPQAMAQPSAILVAETICPVTGKPIPAGLGVKTIVRDHEYTVIDEDAATELKANPDKYLQADGTPKNQDRKA
jgi:hypothetical protein